MYLLSGTLLRLSSVKAGMMVGMTREEEREKGVVLKKGWRVEWVYGSASPVQSTRSPFTPFPRSGYIYRNIAQGTL